MKDEIEFQPGLPFYCPACGKRHNGHRLFGSFMLDNKTPCDGYDCERCGHRWFIIRKAVTNHER